MKKIKITKKTIMILFAAIALCFCGCGSSDSLRTYYIGSDLGDQVGASSILKVNDDISFNAPGYPETVVLPDVPSEYTVEFMDELYNGQYKYSTYNGTEYTHTYCGDSFYVELRPLNRPCSIHFQNKNPFVNINEEPLPQLSEEELINKAKDVFERYGKNGLDYCREPVLEIHESKMKTSMIQRTYVVNFNYRDERIKNSSAFSVSFSAHGEIIASSMRFYDEGAAWLLVNKDLSYDYTSIREKIRIQCDMVIKTIEDRTDREFTGLEIGDGVIRYVYLGKQKHIGIVTRAVINYIQEYPDSMVDKGYTEKHVEVASGLTFVTILD